VSSAADSKRLDALQRELHLASAAQTNDEESSALRLQMAETKTELEALRAQRDESEAKWQCKYNAAELARTETISELERSIIAANERHSSMNAKHEDAMAMQREELLLSASVDAEKHAAAAEEAAARVESLREELAKAKQEHSQKCVSLQCELAESTTARQRADQRAADAVAAEAEHKSMFLATKDALNKALGQQQFLTEEQEQWRLGAESVLRSQVASLSSELTVSATQRSTIESEWSNKHDLAEKERKRLVSELEAAQVSAAAAQRSLTNEHDMAVTDLRGKLDALREELREQETAGLAARDTISELQQKLFGQADNGSGVTALHAQLRTVSSELESVKTQQAVAQTEEMTDLRAQLKSVTAELHRTKLQNSEDIRLQDAESRNSEHQRLTHELNLFKSAAEFETTGHSALVAEHELALAAM